MHKADGTAIWFEEAAEQLGVDTIRWMYLAQNPAADLRFGTRHPNRPVVAGDSRRSDREDPRRIADLRSRQQAGRRNPPAGADPALEHVRVLRQLRAARRIRSTHAGGAGGRAARDRPLDPLQPAVADRRGQQGLSGVRHGVGLPAGGRIHRRPVELVHPPEPSPLLAIAGRRRSGQAGRLPDAVFGAGRANQSSSRR